MQNHGVVSIFGAGYPGRDLTQSLFRTRKSGGEIERSKADGQLGMDYAPVLPPAGPLFLDIHHDQIQHFQQAVAGGENRFGLSHLAQLAVETLNGIGGIDQPPNFLRVLETGAQIGPFGPPELGYLRMFLVPALRKCIQGFSGH